MMHLIYARIADTLNEAGIKCFVGDPPENIPVPYCFVWGTLPIDRPIALSGTGGVVSLPVHVQVVHKQAPDVLGVAQQVRNLLQGVVLEVEGFRVFPLKVTGSEPVQTVRGVINEPSNTYPAWMTLHIQVRATRI